MAKKDNKNESKAKKQFFKDFKAELKKVIWPTPKQLVNNTTAVVAIVLVTAAIVFVLDVVFELLKNHIYIIAIIPTISKIKIPIKR